MNNGTGWPFGGPQINTENAAGKLVVQIYELKAGQALNEKIVVQDTVQQKLGATLRALTAYGSKGEIINILEKADEFGALNWKPGTGTWKLYAAFASEQTGIRSFFNDSYEVYNADFSPKLLDEFQKRRGYDVRNYLRELVSKENSDLIARIRSDYRLTVAEMVYENFS